MVTKNEAKKAEPKCLHGRRPRECVLCNPCPHGKLKKNCSECRPCPHGKVRQNCSSCRPCPHGKLKQNCDSCAAQKCEHGKDKRNCPTCCAQCKHGRAVVNCKACRRQRAALKTIGCSGCREEYLYACDQNGHEKAVREWERHVEDLRCCAGFSQEYWESPHGHDNESGMEHIFATREQLRNQYFQECADLDARGPDRDPYVLSPDEISLFPLKIAEMRPFQKLIGPLCAVINPSFSRGKTQFQADAVRDVKRLLACHGRFGLQKFSKEKRAEIELLLQRQDGQDAQSANPEEYLNLILTFRIAWQFICPAGGKDAERKLIFSVPIDYDELLGHGELDDSEQEEHAPAPELPPQ